MEQFERYIRVGKEKVAVDIHTYRAFNRVRQKQYEQNQEYHAYTVPLSEVESTAPTIVEDEVDRRLRIEQLHKALESLTGEEYLLIHELFYCRKNQQQVAQILGIAQSTVHYRKKKILRKLKNYLDF